MPLIVIIMYGVTEALMSTDRDSPKRMHKGQSAFLCLKSKPNSRLGPNSKVKVKLSHISAENTKMNEAVSYP